MEFFEEFVNKTIEARNLRIEREEARARAVAIAEQVLERIHGSSNKIGEVGKTQHRRTEFIEINRSAPAAVEQIPYADGSGVDRYALLFRIEEDPYTYVTFKPYGKYIEYKDGIDGSAQADEEVVDILQEILDEYPAAQE